MLKSTEKFCDQIWGLIYIGDILGNQNMIFNIFWLLSNAALQLGYIGTQGCDQGGSRQSPKHPAILEFIARPWIFPKCGVFQGLSQGRTLGSLLASKVTQTH